MNTNSRTMITGRMPRLALASVVLLGAAVATGEAFAQSTTIGYGRITEVRQVDLRNQSAANTGALIGGLSGVATGSGQSSSNRALRGVGGAALGRRVGAAAGSTTGFEYTVLIGNQTTRIVTENAGLRVRVCVSVERGSFNNIRLAPDERCDKASTTVSRDARADANACVAAKDQVMKANTDAEFERAERRMRLVCD
jgi:outer membrane lipoprotein SlyB